MLIGEKKNPKKLPTCPADYVVDIPRLILNSRHKIQYECVQYLGAVSPNVIANENDCSILSPM